MNQSPFLKSVSDFMHAQRYSRRTIDSYLYWIKLFILFNGKKHPSLLNDDDIKRFLTFLATERNVASGTQALALNAIVYLKTKYLNQTVGDLSGFNKSHKQPKLPVVLTLVVLSQLSAQGVRSPLSALTRGVT